MHQNSHGNYIVDHGKSWKKHGIVFFFNFCRNPVNCIFCFHRRAVISIGVEEEDKKHTWMEDAESVSRNIVFQKIRSYIPFSGM